MTTHLATVSIFTFSSIVSYRPAPIDTSGFDPVVIGWPGGGEEFSVVAGVVLPVEKCEESEVSELRSRERSGVAQKRLRFVFLEFL